jgi:hypothetical protein
MDEAPRVIFQGNHLRAALTGSGGNGLFVTFDNWRKDRAGFPPLPVSKTALRLGYANLSITTASNDWFLNADLGPLNRVLADLPARYPVVRAMGFSMGGYGALLFSRVLAMKEVVLFAPQVALRADLVPFERRWRRDAALIDLALDDLAAVVPDCLRGVVIFDPCYARAERLHARAIQALAPHIALAPMPFSGHPPTAVIMGTGAFRSVQEAAVNGTLTATTVRQIHRTGREKTDAYLNGMLKRLRRKGALDG